MSSSARIAGAGRQSMYRGNEKTTRSAEATAARSSSVASSVRTALVTRIVSVATPRFSSSSRR